MSRPQIIDLPVGEKPEWEHEEDNEDEGLKSVSDSSVILQSLRQSRDLWLSSIFTKFSNKGRTGKPQASDPKPPPHTIQTRGKCDFEVGPHTFSTTFYEVHYLPFQTHTPFTYQPPAAGGGSWQSTTPYGASSTPSHQLPSNVASTSLTPIDSPSSASPFLSSLSSVTMITPALIGQVNMAASSNPTLSKLLQLAAAGNASPAELKTLGLLIQSLAATTNTPPVLPAASETLSPTTVAQGTAMAAVPQLASPSLHKEFDLVIEFVETSFERWVFPRGPVVCEREIDSRITDAAYDIIITCCVPFPKTSDSTSGNSKIGTPSHVVTIRLKRAPLAVWDTISRWAGGDAKMKENRKILDKLRQPDRSYLGYQLPEGPLLAQLQAASKPTSSLLKALKPSPTTVSRPKRARPAQRKPAEGTAPRKAPTEAPKTTPPATGAVVAKRQKVSHTKSSTIVSPIRCTSCFQTDVPLILGGRFCRPCVDAGKATAVPQVYKFSSFVPNSSILQPMSPVIPPSQQQLYAQYTLNANSTPPVPLPSSSTTTTASTGTQPSNDPPPDK